MRGENSASSAAVQRGGARRAFQCRAARAARERFGRRLAHPLAFMMISRPAGNRLRRHLPPGERPQKLPQGIRVPGVADAETPSCSSSEPSAARLALLPIVVARSRRKQEQQQDCRAQRWPGNRVLACCAPEPPAAACAAPLAAAPTNSLSCVDSSSPPPFLACSRAKPSAPLRARGTQPQRLSLSDRPSRGAAVGGVARRSVPLVHRGHRPR